jgi:pyruvate dehydrogenase E1 component beta subunit/2-oxoisovalerate dehydrogenase E1 component beta subunit
MSTAYIEAIRMALGDSLEQDPRVFLYGQDIAAPFGGAFKATKGLGERFPKRVLNAPISEDGITGVAIGAAISGMRPVIEFQFADFASLAFNQLVNHAATIYWRAGKPCPITARFPMGGTSGAGPFHCQMPEAWLSNHPGLVVVCPSTVADAYHMLRDAVACNDPVMYLEHKFLYNHLRDDNDPRKAPRLPLGAAAVRRQGTDCTLVSYSAMVHECLSAAQQLERDHGIEVEVIDLRCVRPIDEDTILESVSRTGRVVVATEAWPFASVAAEVLAMLSNRAFHYLDAPPVRLCALDVPIPSFPALFAAQRPDAARIASAVLETVSF